MTVRLDTVLDRDSRVRFTGNTDQVAEFLEGMDGIEPLWVSVGETGDLMTGSQYLDLASEDDDIVLDRDMDAVVPWYVGGSYE